MWQESLTRADTPHAPSPARSRLVTRFINEFKQALTPLAESADLAVALIVDNEAMWLTDAASHACAQVTNGLPACFGEACTSGRGLLTSQVFCDSEYIGDLAICNPIEQPYLAGVTEYLARAAASRIAQERREESLLEELSDSWESLEAVYEISADLHTIQNASDLLDRIIRRAAAVADGLRAVLWLEQGGELKPLVAKNVDDLQPKVGDSSLLRRSMAVGSPVVINDPATNLEKGQHVRHIYKRADVEHAWAQSHRTVYLVYPEGTKLPPDRFGHWDGGSKGLPRSSVAPRQLL